MFKKFNQVSGYDQTLEIPIVINMNKITSLQPVVSWQRNEHGIDTMVIVDNQIIIHIGGTSWHVAGNFDELSNMLQSLNEFYE